MPAPIGVRSLRVLRAQDSREVQILEAVGNLARLRQDLLLTDEDRDAIDGDLVVLQQLRTKHWDTATPAGLLRAN